MTDDNAPDAGAVDLGWRSDLPVHCRFNLAAELHPPTSGEDAAGVKVAGAYVGVWVTSDGELAMSLELGEAEAWLLRADGTVPVRLVDGEDTLFTADVRPAHPSSRDDTALPPGKVIRLPQGRASRRPPPSSF